MGTSEDQLANPDEPKKKKSMPREEIAKSEEEMETIEREVKSMEQTYGENMLNLTSARGYVKRLLDNAKVVRFMNGNYPDFLAEFESIAADAV
jgi:hypothetical protein